MVRLTFGVLYAAAVLTGLMAVRQATREILGEAEASPPPLPIMPPPRLLAPSTATIH